MKDFISGDYYATLGVKESAHQDEIKRAYRKAVLDCHPDHHPGDKGAEEEFKRVSEAYGILGDAERRRHYDLVAGLIGPGKHADDAVNASRRSSLTPSSNSRSARSASSLPELSTRSSSRSIVAEPRLARIHARSFCPTDKSASRAASLSPSPIDAMISRRRRVRTRARQ